MPDGSSGLSLSEMGISTVKKTAGGVKKVTSPVGQQVKQQVGGTFVPGQSVQLPSSKPPSETAPKQAGGFDIGSLFGEKNPFGPATPTQTSQQQTQDPQLAAQFEQQKAKEQQQIESLRKKLHDMYYDDFKNKAEGTDGAKQQEEKKRLSLQQDEEERKRQEKEELMQPLQMSQSPQKGMQRAGKKKSGFSFLKLLKPKQGSHEGKAGKG